MALVIFWLILKAFRYGDNFEWFVTLGSWEELQFRLDRLASAIVTDAPAGRNLLEAEGAIFEMNHRTQSPLQQRESSTTAMFTEPSDSDYVTSRAATGLGFGLGNANQVNLKSPRTPSPRTTPSRDVIQAREQTNNDA